MSVRLRKDARSSRHRPSDDGIDTKVWSIPSSNGSGSARLVSCFPGGRDEPARTADPSYHGACSPVSGEMTMPEGVDSDRRRFLGVAAMSIASAHVGLYRAINGGVWGPRDLAALDGAAEWLNSPRLTQASLAGKVVLVQFWTYTCINWLRTLPYVRAWSQKYRQGFVVIGVHTPEFAVEHDVAHVRRAVRQTGIEYPVVIDNGSAIWHAFGNRYWPALYLVDARGRVRDHHFGEGEYERSETIIQRLLGEAGAQSIGQRRPCRWKAWARKHRRTGPTCDRRRTTSVTTARKASRHRAVPKWIDVVRMPRLDACRSMSGRWRESGRWADRRPFSTIRTGASPIASTRAICISSWATRSSPRSRGGRRGNRAFPRLDRRTAAGCCSRCRRRRTRQRHGSRTASVSADSAAEADRRSAVRDRVPRRRRRDTCLYVRLK